MRIDSSGRVGIGTTPEEIFHIKGPTETIGSRDGVLLQHSTASNAADNGLPLVWSGYISASNTNYGLASICGRKENSTDNNGAAYLQFGTGNGAGAIAEKMRIDSNGNVGIGTSSPGAMLHLAGTSPFIRFTDTVDSSHYAHIGHSDTSVFVLDADAANAHANSGIEFKVDNSSVMFLKNGGNVGIGTTSPTQTLDITASNGVGIARFINTATSFSNDTYTVFIDSSAHTSNMSSAGAFAVDVNSGRAMTINGFGRVGIGTNNPTGVLEIDAASTTDMIMLDVGGANFAKIGHNASSGVSVLDIRSEGHYRILTGGNTERMRIDSSGDVLIGTTTSAGKLTVDSGTSNTCATFQSSDAGAGINLKDNNARSSIEQNGTDLKISSDTGAEDANSTIKLQVDGSTKLRINSDGNTSFNGSSAVNCDIDIDGEQIDVANPLGNNVGNGVNPTFRVFASNSNKNVLFSSMWGGDNVVHKQMEFTGGNRIVYDGTADNEMARFTGDDFLVGTTSNSSAAGVGLKLNFGSTNPTFNTVINQSTGNHSFYHLYNTNATHNAYRFYVQVNGGIANHSGNNVNLSDERMKKNITNMGSVYSTFKQFVFRDFNYIDDEASESKKHGVIAQEVETIDADLITDDFKIGGDKDENYVYRKALKEEQFVMIGLKALQEAITKIDTLEAKVAALEAA